MGHELTLRERLRGGEGHSPSLTIEQDTQAFADSVLRHLRNMLNMRVGHALAQPDYGMPDGSEFIHSVPDAVDEVRRVLKNSIEKFEPRLRHVRVKFCPEDNDPLRLRFEVMADLVMERDKASLWFETKIDSRGHIDIKG
ncbi:MAG: type VI secretion system baseplate subunit TssE [Nitrospira sp.]|nr:type VI secretion system baseplate subunit TssE [Nitrospira sp.]